MATISTPKFRNDEIHHHYHTHRAGAADGMADEVANVVSNEGADEVASVAADGQHGASVEQLMGYTWSLGS